MFSICMLRFVIDSVFGCDDKFYIMDVIVSNILLNT